MRQAGKLGWAMTVGCALVLTGCGDDSMVTPTDSSVSDSRGDADAPPVDTCAPTAESCNGADDDCDGTVDEDDGSLCPSTGAGVTGGSCSAGACVLECDVGLADCDGDAANGCEATLGTPEHCAACGNACGGACVDAECAMVRVYHGIDCLDVKLAVDASGNVAVAGQLVDDEDFGGGVRAGGSAVVLLLSPDGVYLRDHLFTPAGGFAEATALAPGASGELLVGGEFSGTLDVGGSSVDASAADAAFAAKIAEDGTVTWSRAFQNTDDVRVRGIAPGSGGRAVVLGMHAGPIDLGAGPTMDAVGENGTFVAAYENDGTHAWERTWVTAAFSSGSVFGFDLAAGPGGDVIFVGGSTTSMFFDGRTPARTIVVALDADGADRWNVATANRAVATDGDGVWVVRTISGSRGTTAEVERRTHADGVRSWTWHGGTLFSPSTSASDVAVLPDGEVIVAGGQVGGGIFRHFSADGDTVTPWSVGAERAVAVATDGMGRVYGAGCVEETATFHGVEITEAADFSIYSLYVVRILPPPPPP